MEQEPKPRKTITPRTQERVHRLAYDFADMAMRARADGLSRLANSLSDISTHIGNIARDDELWRP